MLRFWRASLLHGLAGGIGCVAVAGWPVPPASAQGPQPVAAAPQGVATAPAEDLLTEAQLSQLLAPIALYPDDLLMQVLMASTYPLEIVQAERWLRQDGNAALQGDALAQALEAQPWDPSVKSLVPFPDVLKKMSDQLDWTQSVGDALLAQQEDVLNTVQVLRNRAHAAGHLESGPQQTVTVNTNVTVAPAAAGVVAPPQQVIAIQPAQPQTVFVPVYDPNLVFGTWPYAAHPPVWFPPPPGWGLANALLTGLAFAGGVALVGSLWGWATPSWGRGSVNVNVNRFNSININRNQINSNVWRHDSFHRQGVAYRNAEIRNRYRGDASSARQAAQGRDQFRGRMQEVERGGGLTDRRPGDGPGLGNRAPGGADRPNLPERPSASAGNRPALADRAPGAGTAQRPNLPDRAGDLPRPAARPAPAQRPDIPQAPSGRPQIQPQQRPSVDRGAPAFQGSRDAAGARAAAQRGAASRQAAPAPRAAAPQGTGAARAAAANRAGARQR